VARAQQHIAAGYGWVVDLDLEKFFDRVSGWEFSGSAMSVVRSRAAPNGLQCRSPIASVTPWRRWVTPFVLDLKTLAEESDFLVVAASGGAATDNLVDRPVHDALGSPGILINVARGTPAAFRSEWWPL
jgi:hypothetical protein